MMWIIYLIGLVDDLKYVLGFLGGLFTLIVVGAWVAVYINKEDVPDYILIIKRLKIGAVCSVAGIIISIFTPSSYTIAAMYVIPKIINNEGLQKLPEKMINVLNSKLDKWMESNKGEDK